MVCKDLIMKKQKIYIAGFIFLIVISAVYILANKKLSEQQTKNNSSDALVPSQVSQIIDLEDGQSVDLAITPVSKTIAGRTVKMLGYNGSIPGPTLRVSEGSEMKIFSKTKRAAQVQPLSRMSSAGRGDHFFSGVFEQFHLLLQIVHGNIPNIILHKNLKLQNEDGKHYL
jgi:hypothetical protein